MTAKDVGRILRCSPFYTEAARFIHRERVIDKKRRKDEELAEMYRKACEKCSLSNKQIRFRVMEESFPTARGGYRKLSR